MCMYGIFKEHGSNEFTTINLTKSFDATNRDEALTEMEQRGYFGAQIFEVEKDEYAEQIRSLMSQGMKFKKPAMTLVG